MLLKLLTNECCTLFHPILHKFDFICTCKLHIVLCSTPSAQVQCHLQSCVTSIAELSFKFHLHNIVLYPKLHLNFAQTCTNKCSSFTWQRTRSGLPTALFNTKLLLNNGHPGNRTLKILPYMHRAHITCTYEVKLVQIRAGWNTVQYSFVMQLVQMRSNLCRWGVEHSTIFICYATCADKGWNTLQHFMPLVHLRV